LSLNIKERQKGFIMKQAVVAIIKKDNKILSISRRHDLTKFGLIGGKVDYGETLEQALIREVKEESNIDIHSYLPIYVRSESAQTPDQDNFLCTCFYVLWWSGEPKSSDEGLLEWLTESELTGDRGAFPDYNKLALDSMHKSFPNHIPLTTIIADPFSKLLNEEPKL
jgi:ADP-ribose pyrophosphatase YjhB (NUDIX family)